MCDTFVAMSDSTIDAKVIFGKNSDRPQGEIQDVISCPAQDHPGKPTLQCTYLQIPQVSHTYATVLSKPRWIWGAEMGANEHGVVIGNEAVWTTQTYKDCGLLGMDLLRLGLERAKTALNALEVIVALLDEYGQGGNCAEHFNMNYHNSFLIADPNDAWVLETAGNVWVAEKINNGSYSISNNLSIHSKGQLRHSDLDRAMEAEGVTDFDFAGVFSINDAESPPSIDTREGNVRFLCQQYENLFSIDSAKTILRNHETDICMHGEFETRGSQISVLSADSCEHWFIEGPFPCQQEYQLKMCS